MAIKGDFISFTYNGVHSTDLGVMRVTSSNRYTDALLPTIQDKTVQAPGSNGTYFFGSYYTQRQITINVAFDEVSESQIRLMRKTFGDQLSHQLIFDDEPYKVYYAKVTGTPQLQYVPFSSPRIYKGEGTFSFTCFDPFAHTPNSNKYLSEYTVGGDSNPSNPIWYKYNNKNEWKDSAGLLAAQTIGSISYDTYDTDERRFRIYNPGDLETDFKFYIEIVDGLTEIKITNNGTNLNSYTLKINPLNKKGSDTHVCFNSKLNLIEGCKKINNNYVKSTNIYNDKIRSGSWFKIPLNKKGAIWFFQPVFTTDYNYNGTPTLEYDYLYF